jgi:hypothetical protein
MGDLFNRLAADHPRVKENLVIIELSQACIRPQALQACIEDIQEAH